MNGSGPPILETAMSIFKPIAPLRHVRLPARRFAITAALSWFFFAGGLFTKPVHAGLPAAEIRDLLKRFNNQYATDVVLGTPVTVDRYTILPVITYGVAAGGDNKTAEDAAYGAVGGIAKPVAILVVEENRVRLLEFSVNPLAEIVSAVIAAASGKQSEKKAAGGGFSAAAKAKPLVGRILFVTSLSFLLGWFLLSIGGAYWFPGRMSAVAETLSERPAAAGLFGVLGIALVLVCGLLFAGSIIGLPFALFLPPFAAAVSLYGASGIPLFIGNGFSRRWKGASCSAPAAAAVGFLPIAVIGLIPVLGPVVIAAACCFGFGAAALRMQRRGRSPESASGPDPGVE